MKYLLSAPIRGASLGQNHKTSIQWRNGVLLADEPETHGGRDLGPDPLTLLLSSLVACTVATLKMYLDHKGLSVSGIQVEANLFYEFENGEMIAIVERKIEFANLADSALEQRLLKVAENCPISKILKGKVIINTHIVT